MAKYNRARCLTGVDPATGTVSPRLLADYSYDYLDRLTSYRSFTTNGTTSTKDDDSKYAYDTLDRIVSQTESHGTAAARSTQLNYLGLSGQVSSERHLSSTGTLNTTKSYSYDAYGHRITLSDDPTDLGAPGTGDPAASRYSYAHDVHGSVSLLLSETGAATASYGYRPYGGADDELTFGDFDPSDRREATSRTDNPLNAYRYTAKRFDSGSGSLDMGARRFGPDTGRFLQRDRYDGALSDLSLSLDPLTQNRYGLAGGNPVSYVEVDGHRNMPDGGGGSVATPSPDEVPNQDLFWKVTEATVDAYSALLQAVTTRSARRRAVQRQRCAKGQRRYGENGCRPPEA